MQSNVPKINGFYLTIIITLYIIIHRFNYEPDKPHNTRLIVLKPKL